MFSRSQAVSGNVSLATMLKWSRSYYQKFDDKKLRANKDILSARLSIVNNLTYDPSTRNWKKTGRNVKIITMVRTQPKSYKSISTIKQHKYPVTFLLQDVKQELNTNFRWRTGSNYKPILPPKGRKLTKAQYVAFADANIRKMIQLQFFFELEWVLRSYNLLFGPCWANRPPRVTNPKQWPFFDKHAFFVLQKVITPLLKNGALNKIVKA
jgi:hypothetical protein